METKIQAASTASIGLDDQISELEQLIDGIKNCYVDKQERVNRTLPIAQSAADVIAQARTVRQLFLHAWLPNLRFLFLALILFVFRH